MSDRDATRWGDTPWCVGPAVPVEGVCRLGLVCEVDTTQRGRRPTEERTARRWPALPCSLDDCVQTTRHAQTGVNARAGAVAVRISERGPLENTTWSARAASVRAAIAPEACPHFPECACRGWEAGVEVREAAPARRRVRGRPPAACGPHFKSVVHA